MGKSSIPPFDQESQRVFQGVNGKVTAQVGTSKKNRPKKGGGVKQVQRYVSLETVDGCYWHPGDQTRLVTCECCRRGGLVSTTRVSHARPVHGRGGCSVPGWLRGVGVSSSRPPD
jgi:hypothetical protein